jgi:nucleoid-associated protein Lsr2
MAFKVRRYMVDDLAAREDPRSEVPADETVRFSVNGAEYAIDLTAENARAFFDAVRPYQEAGRRVRGPRRPRPAAERQQTASIRAWARENGLDVKDWGRLPVATVRRYKEAQAALAT